MLLDHTISPVCLFAKIVSILAGNREGIYPILAGKLLPRKAGAEGIHQGHFRAPSAFSSLS